NNQSGKFLSLLGDKLMMRFPRILFAFLLTGWIVAMSAPISTEASERVTKAARQFVDEYTAKVKPLEIAAGRAWWEANITGKDEAFQLKEKTENEMNAMFADKEAFQKVKRLKESGQIDDPIVERAIDIIYL